MKKNITLWATSAVIVAAIITGAVIFTTQKQKPTPLTPQPQDTSNNTTEPEQEVTITYTDSGFSPTTYTIKVGGTVTVVNNSSRDLEFSSDNHPTHTVEPELNMTTLQPGKSGSLTVTRAGTWGFHNHLNAQDIGTLTVK